MDFITSSIDLEDDITFAVHLTNEYLILPWHELRQRWTPANTQENLRDFIAALQPRIKAKCSGYDIVGGYPVERETNPCDYIDPHMLGVMHLNYPVRSQFMGVICDPEWQAPPGQCSDAPLLSDFKVYKLPPNVGVIDTRGHWQLIHEKVHDFCRSNEPNCTFAKLPTIYSHDIRRTT